MSLRIPISDDLELRQREPEDAEELFALTDANRGYLKRWLPWLQFCCSSEDTLWNIKGSLRDAAEGAGLALTICERGAFVGVTGFNSIDKENRSGQIGYWLGQEHQGRGIMSRAVWAMVSYGFEQMGLNRVTIAAATGNLKSRAIAERLSFRLEGIAREAEWLYGRAVDHAIYALTRSDWEAVLAEQVNENHLRTMQTRDISAAIDLWLATEGIGLSPEETPEMLGAFLDRNIGISSVVVNDDGKLVGALLGGHNGRSGYLYHLAVDKAHRGRGLGRKLVQRTTEKLAEQGIARATIMVYAHHQEGRAFWEHSGWKIREDLNPMQINL